MQSIPQKLEAAAAQGYLVAKPGLVRTKWWDRCKADGRPYVFVTPTSRDYAMVHWKEYSMTHDRWDPHLTEDAGRTIKAATVSALEQHGHRRAKSLTFGNGECAHVTGVRIDAARALAETVVHVMADPASWQRTTEPCIVCGATPCRHVSGAYDLRFDWAPPATE